MEKSKPEELGGYRIDAVMARHGCGGSIYRAYHEPTNRVVALKHLPAPPSGAPSAERFEREMRLARHLQHPNVVRVLEAVQLDSGDRLIAMDLIEGEDLASRAREGRTLPDHAVAILAQLAAALGYAHREGVVHRDIKPANAMVDASGHAYLMDFGLARHPEDTTVTADAQVLGTVAYMSPEQARGRRANTKSDVYALTGVLYTLLTGRLPYPGELPAAMLLAHIQKPPPRPSEIFGDLRHFDRVVAAGMAKSWDRRLPLDGLLDGARLAASDWAAREAGEKRESPRRSRMRSTSFSSEALAPMARDQTATTAGIVSRESRSPASAIAVMFRERRVPLTMAVVFLLTLASLFLLRSLAA
jgi:serine/threonine protein kinase